MIYLALIVSLVTTWAGIQLLKKGNPRSPLVKPLDWTFRIVVWLAVSWMVLQEIRFYLHNR